MSDWARSAGDRPDNDRAEADRAEADRAEASPVIDRAELISEIAQAFETPPAGLLLIDLQTEQQAARIIHEIEPGDRILITGPTSRAVIRAAITAPAEADGLAHRLHKVLTEPDATDGQPRSPRATIGVATSLTGDTADHLLRYAEHSLGDATMLGGNQVVVFDDEDRELLLP